MEYCTSTDVYSILDMEPSQVSSTAISQHITEAAAQINREFGTVFISTISQAVFTTETYDATLNGTTVSDTQIILNNYPLVELSTINIDGNNVTSTQFVTRPDRISIGTSATIASFGWKEKSVRIGYKYGLHDEDAYNVAKKLNIYMAALDFMRTPRGRDAVLDNSRYAEINQNNVRPNDMVQLYIGDMQSKILELKARLGKAHVFF